MDTVKTSQRERKMKLEDFLIIDCDVHVHDNPGALIPYCDMPWRKALENIQDIPERCIDIPGFSPGESNGGYQARFPSGFTNARKVFTPEQMRADLSSIHVTIGILFPNNLLKIAMLTQHDYAAALARAYNAWIVDQWASVERGLLACIIACPQDPLDAASQIRRYAQEPAVVGIFLPCAGLDPLWGHHSYDPIYAAAQEADLPVILHSVTVTHPVFPFNNHGFDNELARHALSHTFSMIANVTSMVTTGVPVRFPELRIATSEAGVSWVPFLQQRLDKEYIGKRREVPILEQRPSHYMRKLWNATQPIEEPENLADLATLIHLCGEDSIIFASDWPHDDFDHPMKIHQLPLSNEILRKIFGENALRLFKIDRQGRRQNLSCRNQQ
ncbi:amidohydrolase [Ktedonosporobacter rubrisoli]|uniref:Amidohydrolase n=1 Tax=Ktedonosporobacter rubrisoli TaxID=2509675 RepID=A0A4P6JP68_KTERU|nr:amidohydrolase family protein [Ktedonosporobacter rubrisoli]QBD77055.1 amidohydrolase [Ktedonosporobacter rubrisoli]